MDAPMKIKPVSVINGPPIVTPPFTSDSGQLPNVPIGTVEQCVLVTVPHHVGVTEGERNGDSRTCEGPVGSDAHKFRTHGVFVPQQRVFGPVPDEGRTPPDVTSRRADLHLDTDLVARCVEANEEQLDSTGIGQPYVGPGGSVDRTVPHQGRRVPHQPVKHRDRNADGRTGGIEPLKPQLETIAGNAELATGPDRARDTVTGTVAQAGFTVSGHRRMADAVASGVLVQQPVTVVVQTIARFPRTGKDVDVRVVAVAIGPAAGLVEEQIPVRIGALAVAGEGRNANNRTAVQNGRRIIGDPPLRRASGDGPQVRTLPS